MKKLVLGFCILAGLSAMACTNEKPEGSAGQAARPDYVLVIHGGAGTITRAQMTAEREAAYSTVLENALRAGEEILAADGEALDAVQAAIRVMEDSELFNAGRGAVFTNAETNEMDASLMDGGNLAAGAVAGVKRIKNPIDLARLVMDRSRHVMLAGEGAETFAKAEGMEFVDPDYFRTDFRLQQLHRLKERGEDGAVLDHDVEPGAAPADADHKYGTVGAVALDKAGDLAAGTSTGGLTNKRWGRIGDSPIIGAGTYADNNSCAVSGTGEGEYFIRATVARSICAMMEYEGATLEEAAHAIVMEKLVEMGGDGGIIALDPAGNIAMVFNTEGMYRASLRAGEDPLIGIYKD